jgi:hypothetical protein
VQREGQKEREGARARERASARAREMHIRYEHWYVRGKRFNRLGNERMLHKNTVAISPPFRQAAIV